MTADEIDPAEMGFVYFRRLDNGKYIAVVPRLYNHIVLIGDVLDHWGYESHWCYESLLTAIAQAQRWNPLESPEPDGWFRHAATGRRRPNGDKSKEYIYA